MQKLRPITMKPTFKRLLTILTIAIASQCINIDPTAKANEKDDLQAAKSKLEKGDYNQALKQYNDLLQQGVATVEVYYGKGLSLIHI